MKVKKCNRCGSTEVCWDELGEAYIVECKSCGGDTNGKTYSTLEEAITEWNRLQETVRFDARARFRFQRAKEEMLRRYDQSKEVQYFGREEW